ncbi:21035_t:CDS:2 [Cetraspora pellucida]|uniref:21035_t:CDS:1 n=1 Tax=Cetraspora pellucida TaxID=1433469 RepID=A0A9N9HMR5_9GLOM|nr:21035_t:CDS:2 [Cetraspora pellucida]
MNTNKLTEEAFTERYLKLRREAAASTTNFEKLFNKAKINKNITGTRGIYTFCIYRKIYYQIGSLLPQLATASPEFVQIYIFDTDHKTQNRHIDRVLQQTLSQNLSIIIKDSRTTDPHHYNIPSASEIVAIKGEDGWHPNISFYSEMQESFLYNVDIEKSQDLDESMRPELLWKKHILALSNDILEAYNDTDWHNRALQYLESILLKHEMRLENFQNMPIPILLSEELF